jgi:hypothetical protein
MKTAVSWVVAPCSQGDHRPDDGGSKYLWDVGKRLPDYMALQPRRQQSSYSQSWEPQILLKFKIISWIHLSITQVFHLAQLRHFRLVSPEFVPKSSIRHVTVRAERLLA